MAKRIRWGWVALVAAATLAGAGCDGGADTREAVRPAASVAGCWGAPEDFLNADITAIVLRLTTVARPSGEETFTGKLTFESQGVNSFAVRGNYKPVTGDMFMFSESFDFEGKAVTRQIVGAMTHRDDSETVNIAWEKEGPGCQAS